MYRLTSQLIQLFTFILLLCLTQMAQAAEWQKIIDNGDTGYSETGSAWRDYENGDAYNGDYRYLSSYESGVARVGTATWTTTIPEEGRYEVAVSFRRTENRTPDADYLVDDGEGGQDAYSVSQVGESALIWQVLGTYTYGEGQEVSVTLDGTDDNYSDCADAVRWKRVVNAGNGPAAVQRILQVLIIKNDHRKKEIQ